MEKTEFLFLVVTRFGRRTFRRNFYKIQTHFSPRGKRVSRRSFGCPNPLSKLSNAHRKFMSHSFHKWDIKRAERKSCRSRFHKKVTRGHYFGNRFRIAPGVYFVHLKRTAANCCERGVKSQFALLWTKVVGLWLKLTAVGSVRAR